MSNRGGPDFLALYVRQPDKCDGVLPTDTMPLARWAKGMLGCKTIGCYISHRNRKAVNVGMTVQQRQSEDFAVMGICKRTALKPVEGTGHLNEYARSDGQPLARADSRRLLATNVVSDDRRLAGLVVKGKR